MTTLDAIMALAHTCCILYSARGEHEGEAWEDLRTAIAAALDEARAEERRHIAGIVKRHTLLDLGRLEYLDSIRKGPTP